MIARAEDLTQRDVRATHGVEIGIHKDGLVVWINIDGLNVLRVMTHGMVPIYIKDDRTEK